MYYYSAVCPGELFNVTPQKHRGCNESGHRAEQTGHLIIKPCQNRGARIQLGISFLWATAWRCLIGGLVNTDGTVSRNASRWTRSVGLRINKTSLDIPKSVWIGNWKEMSEMTHLASVKKASSTPSLIFADVSMKRMPSSSASSQPCSSVTARLSVQSDLLPIRILLTPSEACCSMFECQVRMSNEPWVLTSGEIKGNGLRTVERALIRDIVYQKNTHCSTVICCSNCSKSLLACSIPLIEGR